MMCQDHTPARDECLRVTAVNQVRMKGSEIQVIIVVIKLWMDETEDHVGGG